MAYRAFFSFHYAVDGWRAAKVRNMGVVEGSQPVSDNDWESVKRGGDAAIQRWIDAQMKGRSCTILLIGPQTANRKWINYEIIKSWNDRKGLVGIYIHNLTNQNNEVASKGANPFDCITLNDGRKLSALVRAYNPPYLSSANVYADIKDNMEALVEEAVANRRRM
ncbi:TIR domain-containing protein [Thermomonospora umbrina]|uniref:TIR-like protein DUF1863 n=1 Tax=Thermomonospora umbrina TaxID=111806 RepID=A0A3D9SL45_9ACTN|nr:TIR domain-containing protein [Thermomonospora umbrina]REE96652.1 TIR-like protein DUF1863 [Thermomonospora umbrina]